MEGIIVYVDGPSTEYILPESEITKVILHPNCVKIEDNAFVGYTNIQVLELNTVVKCIGLHAFKNCHLKSVFLPMSLEEVSSCDALGKRDHTVLDLSPNLKVFNHNLFRKNTYNNVDSLFFDNILVKMNKSRFENFLSRVKLYSDTICVQDVDEFIREDEILNDNRKADIFNKYPLHCICYNIYASSECILLLAKKYPESVFMKDINGFTPLKILDWMCHYDKMNRSSAIEFMARMKFCNRILPLHDYITDTRHSYDCDEIRHILFLAKSYPPGLLKLHPSFMLYPFMIPAIMSRASSSLSLSYTLLRMNPKVFLVNKEDCDDLLCYNS